MAFRSPPDPAAFRAQVYEWVARIPIGSVMSYGQIARLIARPRGILVKTYSGLGPRWVGAAMAQAPEGLPWQRVVNSQGRISARPGGGAPEQRRLLEEEGVEFSPAGRIDLKRFAHNPRVLKGARAPVRRGAPRTSR